MPASSRELCWLCAHGRLWVLAWFVQLHLNGRSTGVTPGRNRLDAEINIDKTLDFWAGACLVKYPEECPEYQYGGFCKLLVTRAAVA